MRARGWRTIAASLALAGCVVACGGGSDGGGGAQGLLPLLAADELVGPMSPDTSSNVCKTCNAGARVYVAWVERSNSVSDAVLFDRSLDGGVTWLPAPVPLSDATTDATDLAICCDGDRVYVAYSAFVGSAEGIRLNRSLDAGTTFLPAEVAVSDPALLDVGDPAICCDGLTVHVAWGDGRDGERDIYYHRSTDGGATFAGADKPLESDTPGANRSEATALSCDGPRVYAAWLDSRAGGSVRLNRSVDAGVTFLVGDVAVSHGVFSVNSASPPHAVCSGATVTVVWADERNGLGDVFCNRSVDAGATFLGTDRRVDTDLPGAAISFAPVACLAGGTLHVAWADFRTGSPGVRYSRSTDAGASFLASDVPLRDAPGVEFLGRPEICCEGSSVVVAWEEGAEVALDILLAVSTDGGRSFSPARADTDPPGASLSFNPGLALDGDRLVVVWQESRGGSDQIRTNRTQ